MNLNPIWHSFDLVICATASPPAARIVLVIGGIVVVFGAFCLLSLMVFNALGRRMSGWSAILTRFPWVDVQRAGEMYKRNFGSVGHCRFSRGFNIRLAGEGVCVYPYFARRRPCLIPWSSITSVSVSNRSLTLVVRYDRPLNLNLPIKALPEVRANIPPELFQNAVSVFDVMKTAAASDTRPRWLWRKKD